MKEPQAVAPAAGNAQYTPASERRTYAAKVWVIFASQITVSSFIALLFYTILPKYDDSDGAVFDRIFWMAFGSILMIGSLTILQMCKEKKTYNYLVLIVLVIPCFGFFWGCTKYFIEKYFGLQVLGVVSTSLWLVALCHVSGLINGLAELLNPKSVSLDANFFMVKMSDDQLDTATDNMVNNADKMGSVDPDKFKANLAKIMDMKKVADGHFRATILVTWLMWLIVQGACMFLIGVPQEMNQVDHVFTCVFTFLLCTYLHFDCERQMRLCDRDDFAMVHMNVNAGLLFFLTCIYLIFMILFSTFSSSSATDVEGTTGRGTSLVEADLEDEGEEEEKKDEKPEAATPAATV